MNRNIILGLVGMLLLSSCRNIVDDVGELTVAIEGANASCMKAAHRKEVENLEGYERCRMEFVSQNTPQRNSYREAAIQQHLEIVESAKDFDSGKISADQFNLERDAIQKKFLSMVDVDLEAAQRHADAMLAVQRTLENQQLINSLNQPQTHNVYIH